MNEAACRPAGSLPSVTTAKMYKRLGHSAGGSAGLDRMLPPASHHLFSPETLTSPSLWVMQLSVHWFHPHTPSCRDAFAFRPFCTGCSCLEGSWSIFQTDFYLSFDSQHQPHFWEPFLILQDRAVSSMYLLTHWIVIACLLYPVRPPHN